MKYSFLSIIFLFLIGCSNQDDVLKNPPNNSTIPEDVPIAKPDPKLDINKNPPTPVTE